jgi:hypothetical protein
VGGSTKLLGGGRRSHPTPRIPTQTANFAKQSTPKHRLLTIALKSKHYAYPISCSQELSCSLPHHHYPFPPLIRSRTPPDPRLNILTPPTYAFASALHPVFIPAILLVHQAAHKHHGPFVTSLCIASHCYTTYVILSILFSFWFSLANPLHFF